MLNVADNSAQALTAASRLAPQAAQPPVGASRCWVTTRRVTLAARRQRTALLMRAPVGRKPKVRPALAHLPASLCGLF